MKKSFIIVLLTVIAFAATSCSATLKTIKEPLVHFQLNSSDYVLSEQVSGEATVNRIFGVDWARLFTNKYGSITTPVYGITTALDFNSQYAIYDLIEKHPGYDFVMYPQFTTKTSGVPSIFEQTTIKVVARLGKVKTR